MRRVFGGEIDRPLLPILVVTLSGSIAGGMLWTFVGVWAIKRLGASDVQLAFGFLGAATSAAAPFESVEGPHSRSTEPSTMVAVGTFAASTAAAFEPPALPPVEEAPK